MTMHSLPALLDTLGLICLGLSLWLQHGCVRGRFSPGRRRFCAVLAVALGVAAPFALLPGLVCMGLWFLCLWS